MNAVICKLTSGIERTAEALIGAFGTLLDKPSGEMANTANPKEPVDDSPLIQFVEDPRHPQHQEQLFYNLMTDDEYYENH